MQSRPDFPLGVRISALAALVALLTWGALAACRPAAPATPTPAAGPVPSVTVPFLLPTVVALAGWFEDAALAALDGQIASFEAANTDTWVEIVRLDRNAGRRQEQITSRLSKKDSTVDLYVLDATWPAELARGSGLAPLDGWLADEATLLNGFIPGLIQANTVDEQLLALPWSADGGLLYYRRDLLDKYGYPPPKNWSELQRIALEVRSKEGLAHGFVWPGTAGEDLTCVTLEFVWSLGGDVLDEAGTVIFDSPQTRLALQQMKDLVDSGASPADVATYNSESASQSFQEANAVFMRNWFSAWESLNSADSPVTGQVGLAPLTASCLGGQSIALSSYSQEPEKARRLMSFLAGRDAQVNMALAATQLPALQAAYEDPELKTQAPILQEVQAGLSAARPRPSVPEYAQMSEAISSEVHRMLSGEQGVDDTVRQIDERLRVLLGQ